MAIEKCIEIKKVNFIAKCSEKYISLKIGGLIFLNFHILLAKSSDKLPETIKSALFVDANANDGETFKQNSFSISKRSIY